jgi:hypothetical protein
MDYQQKIYISLITKVFRQSKYGTPTRCNNNSFLDLKDQLNMFRANFCLSSGTQDLDFLQHMVQAGVSKRVAWHYVYVCVTDVHVNVVPSNTPGYPAYHITGHCNICCKSLILALVKMGKRWPETC